MLKLAIRSAAKHLGPGWHNLNMEASAVSKGDFMSALREELHQLLESLPEEELSQVRDFVKMLRKEPEDLTERERQDAREGEEEIRRGEWVWWEEVRRKGV